MVKRVFSAPSVTDLGSIAALTQGGADGNFLDDTFPTNTPRGQLTFS